MDHVIEYILNYMSSEIQDFIKEWNSGNYKKISDCPTYLHIKAYCDAIKALNRLDGRFGNITPKRYLNGQGGL